MRTRAPSPPHLLAGALVFVSLVASPRLATAGESDSPSEPTRWIGVGAGWDQAFASGSRSRDGVGAAVEGRFNRRLGVRLQTTFFTPFNARDSGIPATALLNETAWSASADVTIVVIRGHSNTALPEIYALGGTGVISTRAVAVVDPVFRTFSFKPKLEFGVGIGARFFLGRFATMGLELRDTIYNEQLEARSVASGPSRSDPGTWYGDNRITHAIELELGIGVLLPVL